MRVVGTHTGIIFKFGEPQFSVGSMKKEINTSTEIPAALIYLASYIQEPQENKTQHI